MRTSPETVLECSDVWKVFGPKSDRLPSLPQPEFEAAVGSWLGLAPAVQEVTLAVKRGECFCIMGLSGSGKSTLVRCMTGLLPLSRGRLEVLGTSLADATEADLIDLRRHRMSMVFQDFALLPHLTALENIAFPLRVQGIARKAREDRARELIDLTGLQGREDYYPHELSGGQQQRVGIGRSLATNPELWFLDEPFSALDPLIRQDLQDELLRLQALLKKTIVFITHDFEEAVRLSNRIAIMKDGLIVQMDTPENLVLRPADDYVARFTRKVALANIVRVASVMQPSAGPTGKTEPIPETALVSEVASRIFEAGSSLPVADETGRIVGSIGPMQILGLMAPNPS